MKLITVFNSFDVPNFDVSFNKPTARITNHKTGTVEVVPRLRKIPSPEPILSSDKHNFHKFKKVEVQDDLKVAFP